MTQDQRGEPIPKTTRAAIILVAVFLSATAASRTASAQDQPYFQVDPSWPKELPSNWTMGQVSGLAVDKDNHIWVLQRPGSNAPDDLGAAQTPPVSQCCFAAPPVLEFDAKGTLLKS